MAEEAIRFVAACGVLWILKSVVTAILDLRREVIRKRRSLEFWAASDRDDLTRDR